MQINIKTPKRSNFQKNVHTPPSIDRHDLVRPKLVKSLSGKLFKRSTELELHDNNALDSPGLFLPAYSMASCRRKVPEPLDLTYPNETPPSLGKSSNISTFTWESQKTPLLHKYMEATSLESPFQLSSFSKKKSWSLESKKPNTTYSLNSGISPHDNEHPIIWMDTAVDPFLEEDSPTYFCALSKNVSKIKSNSGYRRFVNSTCILCDEKMSSILTGEKIIEVTCSHACHYECYLTILESLYFEKEYPFCRTCKRPVKPADEEILENMVSKLLTKKKTINGQINTVGTQNLHRKLYNVSSQEPYTPMEQLIKSADICCDGFQSPGYKQDTDYQYLTKPLVKSGSNSREMYQFTFSDSPDDGFSKNHVLRKLFEQSELELSEEIDLEPNCSPFVEIVKHDSHIYSVVVKTIEDPNSPVKKCESKGDDPIDDSSQFLRRQIELYIKKVVDPGDNFASLIIFDRVNYSIDGEQWIEDVTAYLFGDNLILYDQRDMTTVGKVPVKEICQVLQMGEQTLLIDLKSRILPEVLLLFKSKNSDHNIMEKWKYYLMGGIGLSHLQHITSTSWSILPSELQDALQFNFQSESQKSIFNSTHKPWNNNGSDVLLQLIVCMNISSYQPEDTIAVGDSLRQILSHLRDNDLFGLVIIGRDGKGNLGKFGTFTGTVSKSWDCWDDIFDSLGTNRINLFQSEKEEVDKMLETCLQLVSTSEVMLDQKRLQKYLKQVVIVSNSELPAEESKFFDTIKNQYEFDICQASSLSELGDSKHGDGSLDFISTLHNKRIKDLTLKIDGSQVSFGNMKQGEEKTVLTNLLKFNSDEKFEYEIEWFDRIFSKLQRSKGTVKATKNKATSSDFPIKINVSDPKSKPLQSRETKSMSRAITINRRLSFDEINRVPAFLQLAS